MDIAQFRKQIRLLVTIVKDLGDLNRLAVVPQGNLHFAELTVMIDKTPQYSELAFAVSQFAPQGQRLFVICNCLAPLFQSYRLSCSDACQFSSLGQNLDFIL